MSEYDNCPKCGVSLQGDPIPEEEQHLFGATHFRREIGLEDPMLYDGIAWWQCPDCQHIWKRFDWVPEFNAS